MLRGHNVNEEAIIPKVGHGPKMGQNESALVFLWLSHLFHWYFIAHTQSQWDMEVLACFRPVFFKKKD